MDENLTAKALAAEFDLMDNGAPRSRNGKTKSLYYIRYRTDRGAIKNPWQVIFFLPADANRKRRQRSIGGFPTEAEAKSAAEVFIERAKANALRARRMGS